MNVHDYLKQNNILINEIFNVNEYTVYHTNINMTLFTIKDDICFAITGSSIEGKNVLNKYYFNELQLEKV